MPEMDPVGELRAAAKLIRERAAALPPGPWTMRDGWGPDSWGNLRAARIAGADEATVMESSSPDGDSELAATREAFEHIASWHPAVAKAVADWLDLAAERIESNSVFGARMLVAAALDVARAYVGENGASQ